jgi:PAS domain S-box-containing protein
MKKNNFTSILLVFFLVFNAQALSQEKIRFEHLSDKDGLPSNAVTSICQDSIGFLWFGTYGGLARYDGNTLKVYQNDSKNPNSISLNFIRSLLIDRAGNLWIGTWGGGLNIYDLKKDAFVSYQHDPEDPNSISSNMINTICEDRLGNVWIATWGGGLNRVDSRTMSEQNNADRNQKITFTHFRSDSTNPNSLAGDKVNSIYEDRSGTLWIATKFGVSKYDPRTNGFINFRNSPDDPFSLSSDNATSICEDMRGNLWISTWDAGLNKFDQSSGKFIRYRGNEKNKSALCSDKIMRLYRDHSGNLWIGTWGGGLDRLVIPPDPGSGKGHTANDRFLTYSNNPLDPGSISDMSIYSIFEDKTGVLWIGTSNFGINKLDKRKMQFTHVKSDPQNPNSLNDDVVVSIYVDRNDLTWLGTNRGGLNIFDQERNTYAHFLHDPKNPFSISDNNVRAIYQDKLGTMWIGTATGFNRYDPSTKRFLQLFFDLQKPSDTDIKSICEDRYGYLWLGSYGEGLVRYDRKKNKFKYYRNVPNDSTSISDNIIWSIIEDREGVLWIGTDHGGLNRYDRNNERFYRYVNDPNDKESISSNTVFSMIEDHEGVLWLATGKGLNKVVKKADKSSQYYFIVYTTDDGLPSNTISGILEDAKGDLWISSLMGISKFNKQSKNIRNYNTGNGLQGNEFVSASAAMNKKTGVMYFGGANGYNYFHPDSIKENLVAPPVAIVDLKIFYKSVPINGEINGQVILRNSIVATKEIVLSYKNNTLSFDFAALQFNSPEHNVYAYKMEGFEEEWHYQGNKNEATYTNLDPGEYTFRVQASNNDGAWNRDGAAIQIVIVPPYWQTLWFRLLMLAVMAGIAYWIYDWRQQTRNLAEKKRIEAVLAKERNLLRALIDSVPDRIYAKDLEGRFIVHNIAVEQGLGAEKSFHLIGKTDFDIAPKETAEAFSRDDRFVVQTDKPIIDREEYVYDESGQKHWLLTSKIPLHNEEGKVTGLVGASRDITNRKLMEEALHESEERFRIIAEQTGQLVYDFQSDAGILHWAGAVEEVTGYAPEEIQNITISDWQKHIHPDDFASVVFAIADAKNFSKQYLIEYRLQCKDGTYIYVEDRGVFLKDESGTAMRMLGAIANITDRKTASLERESLISSLQSALADVKTLSGLVPICSNCKKIRDDRGYWTQLEAYIQEHSAAKFSHGVCPDCMSKLYPGLAAKVQGPPEQKKT